MSTDLPFDGAISDFFHNAAPDDIRAAISDAKSKDILSDTYPYAKRMSRDDYDEEIAALQ